MGGQCCVAVTNFKTTPEHGARRKEAIEHRILLTLVAAFGLTVAAAADAEPFPATFRHVHIERVAEHAARCDGPGMLRQFGSHVNNETWARGRVQAAYFALRASN